LIPPVGCNVCAFGRRFKCLFSYYYNTIYELDQEGVVRDNLLFFLFFFLDFLVWLWLLFFFFLIKTLSFLFIEKVVNLLKSQTIKEKIFVNKILNWNFYINNLFSQILCSCLCFCFRQSSFQRLQVCFYNLLSPFFVLFVFLCQSIPREKNLIQGYVYSLVPYQRTTQFF